MVPADSFPVSLRRFRILRGGAREARFHAERLKLGRSVEIGGDVGKLIERHDLEERFQKDFGFAQAGAEIIVEPIENRPAIAGLHAQSRGNIACSVLEFTFEVLDRFGKNPQFVKKPGPAAEKHVMEDPVPGSRALSRITAKELCV